MSVYTGANKDGPKIRILFRASKIAKLTGWHPRHTLDEIIDDVASDMRRRTAAN